jgi:hypothetical protein
MLGETLAIWLVADCEALFYQATPILIRAKTLKLALQRQLTKAHVGISLFFNVFLFRLTF